MHLVGKESRAGNGAKLLGRLQEAILICFRASLHFPLIHTFTTEGVTIL